MQRAELLKAYLDAGFALVPIPKGQKRPVDDAWALRENCVTDPADLKRIRANVGIAHAYCGTCAIDVDNIALTAPWLAERGVVLADLLNAPDAVKILSGRDGRTKLLYKLPADCPPLISRKPKNSGVELRCGNRKDTTLQDVLPPSIHPDTGKPYIWEGDFAKLPELPTALLTIWRQDIEAAHPRSQAPDEILDALREQGLYIRDDGAGKHVVLCPWYDQHNGGSGAAVGSPQSEAVYFEPHTGGFAGAAFDCKHATHGEKTIHDLREYLGLDDPNGKPTFSIFSAQDMLERPPIDWLVKSLVPKSGIGAIVGPSSSGKTFLALDMAGAILRGAEFFGRKTLQGDVVYVSGEGSYGFAMRVKAYAKHNRCDLSGLHVIEGYVNVRDFDQMADLSAKIIRRVQRSKGIRLIVVDTLNATIGGGDENSAKDLGEFLAGMRYLARECGAFVLVIHHVGKDATRGFRGHSSGFAALDVELTLERDDGAVKHFRTTKERDGDDSQRFSFALEVLELGEDNDGDPITSCYVKPLGFELDSDDEETEIERPF